MPLKHQPSALSGFYLSEPTITNLAHLGPPPSTHRKPGPSWVAVPHGNEKKMGNLNLLTVLPDLGLQPWTRFIAISVGWSRRCLWLVPIV